MQVERQSDKPQGAQRLLSIALSCFLALSVIVSVFVITQLHDHDCTGDDCEICAIIAIAQSVITAPAAPAARATTALLLSAVLALVGLGAVLHRTAQTLVTQKVKIIV